MDKPINQVFYEEMYADGRVGRSPGGLLGKMFMMLRKFELHRIPAAANLLGPGDKILDIGCGDGGLISLVKNKKLFKKYYGTDLVDVVVNRAKTNIKKETGSLSNVNINVASFDSKLPFKNDFFETVTCISVLEHIFDPYFSVREVNRVLKRGGILVLEVPNLVFLPRRIDILFGRLPITGDEDGWDGGHLHYFTFEETIKLLKTNGFEIKYSGSTGIFPGVRNIAPELLGGNILIKAKKIRNAKN